MSHQAVAVKSDNNTKPSTIKKFLQSVKQGMLSLDKFREEFKFRIVAVAADNDASSHTTSLPTILGSLISLLLLALILSYFVMKIDVLLGRKDVDILSAVNEDRIGIN